jgi:anthranilate synthase component 1
VFGNDIRVETDGKCVEQLQTDDPFAFVTQYQQRFQVAELENLPMFNGGLVGYFAYDCVRYVEPKLKASQPKDVIGNPDILLMVSDEVLVFDNLAGKLSFIVHANPSETNALQKAEQRLNALEKQLQTAEPSTEAMKLQAAPKSEQEFTSHYGKDRYEAAVETIKEYALAGDIMQVVPSQRLSLPFTADPLNLYRALRVLNPSPYMYFLDLTDHTVVGSSPEILARLENGEVTVRPIAGTRRRGHTPEEDAAMEKELVNDPKEIAEHLMLIDLGRNDVGRVAEVGSVLVTEQMVVERYSHVMHITSNVTGKLKSELTAMDVLRAALPAGTLSGAPKIRAMEIIDELETEKRGVYGGAVGYLGWNGNMDTAIAIRTAVIKNNVLYVQAGGGIVADSVPALEWKETMNKARAIFRAVDMVQ